MLKELGVRFVRRWMMWTAVAFGTRWRARGIRRLSVSIWAALAILGMAAFAYGVMQSNIWVVIAAMVGPFATSLLWGRQYGAGLTAAISVIWVLPPTAIGAVGYAFYLILEKGLSFVLPSRQAGDEPATYTNF